MHLFFCKKITSKKNCSHVINRFGNILFYIIFHLSKVASEPPTVMRYISSNKNRIATTADEAVFSSVKNVDKHYLGKIWLKNYLTILPINSALGVVQG